MELEYSLTELLKAIQKKKEDEYAERLLHEIYLDLFLRRLHRKQTYSRILDYIDDALDRNDREAFQEYTALLQKYQDRTTVA